MATYSYTPPTSASKPAISSPLNPQPKSLTIGGVTYFGGGVKQTTYGPINVTTGPNGERTVTSSRGDGNRSRGNSPTQATLLRLSKEAQAKQQAESLKRDLGLEPKSGQYLPSGSTTPQRINTTIDDYGRTQINQTPSRPLASNPTPTPVPQPVQQPKPIKYGVEGFFSPLYNLDAFAQRITYPVGDFIYRKTGVTREDVGRAVTKASLFSLTAPNFQIPVTEKERRQSEGFYTEVVRIAKDEPGSTAVISLGVPVAGRFVASGAKIAGAQALIKTAPLLTPTTTSVLGRIGSKVIPTATKAGLGGLYAYEKGKQFSQAQSPEEQGAVFGKIAVETGGLVLGSKVTQGLKVPGEQYYEARLKPQVEVLTQPDYASVRNLKAAKAAGEVGYELSKVRDIKPKQDIQFDDVVKDSNLRSQFREYVKKSGSTIGGSQGQKTYLNRDVLRDFKDVQQVSPTQAYRLNTPRTSKDVDIFIKGKNVPKEFSDFTDVHTYSEKGSNPFSRTPEVTPEGIKVLSFGEQSGRKVQGAFTIRSDKATGENSFYRFGKDINDLIANARQAVAEGKASRNLVTNLRFLEGGYAKEPNTFVSTLLAGKQKVGLVADPKQLPFPQSGKGVSNSLLDELPSVSTSQPFSFFSKSIVGSISSGPYLPTKYGYPPKRTSPSGPSRGTSLYPRPDLEASASPIDRSPSFFPPSPRSPSTRSRSPSPSPRPPSLIPSPSPSVPPSPRFTPPSSFFPSSSSYVAPLDSFYPAPRKQSLDSFGFGGKGSFSMKATPSRYNPSLFGLDVGKSIGRAPRVADAIGIRAPLASQVKGLNLGTKKKGKRKRGKK